ncbi:MAG: hypothetical protein RLZZ490_1614 [Cyanobacteriota bacterium]|jgi:hypothetical protein
MTAIAKPKSLMALLKGSYLQWEFNLSLLAEGNFSVKTKYQERVEGR